MRIRQAATGLALAALLAGRPAAGEVALTVLAPVELHESGFLAEMGKRFRDTSGIKLQVIAGETGPIDKLVEKGDGDVLFAAEPGRAERLAKAGHVVDLQDALYAERVVIGPQRDLAGIAGMASVIDAFARIAATRQPFLSRADNSALYRAELALWEEAGFDPEVGDRDWYHKARKKMSLTIKLAAAESAYTLADRASWLRFGNQSKLIVHVDADPRLLIVVQVMRLDPRKHPKVQTGPARAFLGWLTSKAGQEAITEFTIRGEPVYYPADGEEG
ncbi:MAG: substrate-binding domain-containing protein [Alphaproteobacteria bacterium]|nr:substrate-binding domain-containing protein [Alphaproteobacteria bacterium]